jgi:hypothetical protein
MNTATVGSVAGAAFAAAAAGLAVEDVAAVAGFAVVAATAGLAAGAAGGAGVWAVAATVQAANIRIRAVSFIAFSNSGWCLKKVYQALRPFCTPLAILPTGRLIMRRSRKAECSVNAGKIV